jgi:hypothetical protein
MKIYMLLVFTLEVESLQVNFRLPLMKIFLKINISSIRSLLCFFGQFTKLKKTKYLHFLKNLPKSILIMCFFNILT